MDYHDISLVLFYIHRIIMNYIGPLTLSEQVAERMPRELMLNTVE